MKIPPDASSRITDAAAAAAASTSAAASSAAAATSLAATAAAGAAARHGRSAAVYGRGYSRVFLACFVAQGAYALLTALAVMAGLLAAMMLLTEGDTNVWAWGWSLINDGGSVSSAPLRYALMTLVGIGVLGFIGTFLVPVAIKLFVRVICDARVSYAWALIANLASWILVGALSALMFLIPGAQPLIAFGVWLASSALTALIIRGRLVPRTPTGYNTNPNNTTVVSETA